MRVSSFGLRPHQLWRDRNFERTIYSENLCQSFTLLLEEDDAGLLIFCYQRQTHFMLEEISSALTQEQMPILRIVLSPRRRAVSTLIEGSTFLSM